MAAPLGAKVVAASVVVTTQGVKVPFGNVDWDSGGFFASSAPRRLRVPASQAGRYVTQLAVRYVAMSDPSSPPVDPTSSYYYAEILVNDQVPGNDARSTVARVPHATGTTQLIVYEANLAPSDRLQARLWHGFSDQVRADVTFQTRRVGDSS
jgi:hypothetical protein